MPGGNKEMQLIQVMFMLIVYIAYVSYEEHAFSLLTQHVQLLTLDTLNNRGGGHSRATSPPR